MELGDRPLRVAAIVPAFNEEQTLAGIVATLEATQEVDEILVVSDGSTDGTVEVAVSMGVTTLILQNNHGKADALAAGVAATTAPVLAFVDGDILNLSEQLVGRLIRPVLEGRAAMNIGVRSRGPLNRFQCRFGPFLSGIRCLRREVFDAVPESCLAGYRIEVGLNWACRRLGLGLSCTVLHGLRHRVKERKRGLWRGLAARVRMFRAVLAAYLRLRLAPPSLRRSPALPRTPVPVPTRQGVRDGAGVKVGRSLRG